MAFENDTNAGRVQKMVVKIVETNNNLQKGDMGK